MSKFKVGDKVSATTNIGKTATVLMENPMASECYIIQFDWCTVASYHGNNLQPVESLEEPESAEELNIEAGKWYQTAFSRDKIMPVIKEESWWRCAHYNTFREEWIIINLPEETIISPWTDRPQIDWASMPKWAKAVWRCENIWKGSGEIPRWDCTVQGYTFPRYTADVLYIPIEYYPTFSGSDKDSLVVREEE